MHRECVFILGGRSGTSALAGALNKMGLPLGNQVMGPARHNPKGFFENKKICKINDKILAALGSDIDDEMPLPIGWHLNAGVRAFADKIRDVIAEEFSGLSTFMIKCPRICVLLPIWLNALKGSDIDPKFVLSLRHPLATARSISDSREIPLKRALMIWLKFTLSAEFFSREHPRVFIRYDDLIESPGMTIDRISRAINVELPRNYEDVRDQIEDFLDPKLKHHTHAEKPVEESDLTDLAYALYRVLDRCADLENEPDYKRTDEIRTIFEKMRERSWLARLTAWAGLRLRSLDLKRQM